MPTDIFTRLEKDHHEMQSLMSSLSTRFDDKKFDRLARELVAHERAEERVLYDSIVKQSPTHEIVLEGFEEHHVADLIMRELKGNKHGTERWMAKFKVLKENIEHHIEEEEGEMFPATRKVVDGARAREMASQFESAKRQVLG